MMILMYVRYVRYTLQLCSAKSMEIIQTTITKLRLVEESSGALHSLQIVHLFIKLP